MNNFYVIGLILAGCVAVDAVKLPDYITKCNRPSDKDCFVKNGNAVIAALGKDGEPKFKIDPITKFHVEKIDLQATPQLKIVLTDIDFLGLENIKIENGKIDENELVIVANIPRLELVGDYDVSGKILILPMKGEGKCNITWVDADVEYTAKLFVEERKGKQYLQVRSDDTSGVKFTDIKRVHFRFDNLFNGDPRLGPELNIFINENWPEVFAEVKEAMEKTAAYSIINYHVNSYLHYVPVDELVDLS